MRIFNPDPEPAPGPGIYAVSDLLSRETWKAVDIVTAGRLPAAPLFFAGEAADGPWEQWLPAVFGAHLAPYLFQARDAAQRGVVDLIAQDRDFTPPIAAASLIRSAAFGTELLESSLGARHMPEIGKLHRGVRDGLCPGHALTVLALRSILFGITTVNVLMAALYCEWLGGSVPSAIQGDRSNLQASFGAAAPGLSRHISAWLKAGGNNAFQSPVEG